MRRRSSLLLVLAAIAAVEPSESLSGQSPDSTQLKHIPLFTRDDAYLGLGFIAATMALAPLDQRVAKALQTPSAQAHQLYQNLATDVRLITDPGALYIGGGLYAIGRLGHFERMADLGLHGTEAILVGSVANDIIKDLMGRARPYVVGDTNPRDYAFLRGWRKGNDYSSFPSGHTFTAFSVAAAVTNETARWWPGSQWYIGPLLYGGATSVAIERLYNNKHWLSDVVMGAGVGILAGNKVVRFNHRTHPGNRLDRWLLSPSIVPEGSRRLSIRWSLVSGDSSPTDHQ